MAEQLGQAVLTVSADTRQLEAGLQRARQQAEQAGGAFNQAFGNGSQGPAAATRSIQALQDRLQTLRASYNSVEIGSAQFRKLQTEIQRTERELQNVDKTLGATFAQRAGGFGGGLLASLGLGLGAGAAVGGFLKGAIDEAVQLETITRKLSNTLGEQGAGAALNFVKGLSDQTGLSFKNLASSFGGFTAAATSANVPLQTQRDLFAAVSRSGQALGLSNDEIDGSLLALQQVASKGTVAMEELRGQLGERLPIALSATARGLGISQKELIKLVESGKLTASEFFPALTKGLNELTSSAGGLPTAAQNFGKFRNAWEQLQASFGKNLLPGVTKSVQVLTDAIEGLSVVNQAKSLGFDNGLFSGGLLSGVSTKGAQAVATLRQVQQQFNLNDQQARNIFSQAVQASGGQYGINGLEFTDDQYGKLLDELTKKAEAFRQKNRDIAAEKRAQDAAEAAALERDNKRVAAAQKRLDVELRSNQAAVQFRNLQEQLASARLVPGLDDAQRTALQNRLSLNEKIRAVQADQLALQRELDKPIGTGDGKPGAAGVATQNQKTIDDLRAKISAGQVQVATTRLQNQQADAAALRTQQDRLRGQSLEAANARAKLGATQQQTQLERQALAAGVEVSRTAQLRLQQEEAIAAAKRQQASAQQALDAELQKPIQQQDRVVLGDLFSRVAEANRGVRQAYADAGLALVQNARNAADALKSAQQSFNSAARGGFQFLTQAEQQRQLIDARASVQRGVDAGLIRTGIDISTPERLFQLAGLSESLTNAQEQLTRAIQENRDATALLAGKDWQVYVSIPGQPTFVPLSNV